MAETKGIFAALMAVNRGVTAIAKSQRNEQQHYKFRGIDDVMNALHPLFEEHGIVVARSDKSLTIEQSVTKKDTVLYFATVTTEWTLYAGDGSSIILTAIGQGSDTGDKAANKAVTAGYKYMLLQLFSIPVEEQDDADRTTQEPVTARLDNSPAPAKMIAEVRRLVEVKGADMARLLDYYDVDTVEALTGVKAAAAIKMLNAKSDKPAPEADPDE